ncbi:MAG: 2-hydroxyacid dehydrogenase [Gammaproteobacteria bacterium]
MPPNVEARIAQDYDASGNPSDTIWSTAELLARSAGQDAVMCCNSEQFTPEVFEALPESVKIVSTFSVGYEHIDIEAAKARGIVVTNTPDVRTDATADVAMLCLLGAARRASEGDRLVRGGGWNNWYTTLMLGVHVTGKRLGIYGMGRIGRAVAQRGRGFNMEIHYYNRSRLEPELEQGATYHRDPESLLRVSQFLSINAPSSPQTRHFFNAERIALLPDGAVVANTARGDLIDDEALIAALRSGKVAAAGLDVYDGEPDLHEAYKSLENTVLLPHLGSATQETRDAMGYCCLDNLDAYFSGQRCPTALT